MNRQFARRANRQDSGFTLIELLVVIIILGILAAVVVFAVSGVGDRGKLAAITTDAKTIRTAQEAFCASRGSYATSDELVSNGFLSEKSTLHEVKLLDGGRCGDSPDRSDFAIFCDAAEEGCGAGGAFANGGPGGAWMPTGGLPVAGRQVFNSTVRLSDGRVFALTQGGTTGTAPLTTQVFDPATGVWTVKEAPGPGRTGFVDALLLEGSPAQCGTRCGWVLVRFIQNPFEWKLYDPVNDDWFATGLPTVKRSLFPAVTLINPGGGRCGIHCGKVIAVGGSNNTEPQTSAQIEAANRSAELYDPVSNTWQLAPGTLQAPGRLFSVAAALPDGRILIAGGNGSAEATAETYDTANGIWTPTSPPGSTYSNGSPLAAGAVPLGNGKVLVAGTADGASANLFDPSDDSWAPAAGGTFCFCLFAAHTWFLRLPAVYGDKVLLLPDEVGLGDGGRGVAMLYNAATDQYESVVPPPTFTSANTFRGYSAAALLGNGQVLIAGGQSFEFDPVSGPPDTAGPVLDGSLIYTPEVPTP